MARHPYTDVAVATVFNTRQARELPGHDALSIQIEAAVGVLQGAGIDAAQIDAVYSKQATELAYELGATPVATPIAGGQASLEAIMSAANAVAAGQASVVLVCAGGAALRPADGSTAPWTRPANEFVASYGMYTAAEFALIARRHMEMYGTTEEQLAAVAATIRNNGHVHPDAVYHGKGPFTPDDVLASRMIAEPFHLLDCCMTSEGAAAMLVTTADIAGDLVEKPVYIIGGGSERMGPPYQHPPSWDLKSHGDIPLGEIGRTSVRRAFATAGVGPDEVDVCEFYDPFSFDIIRQLETFCFCEPGEGGDFVASGAIGPGGSLPVTTDGGLMSFSHPSSGTQMIQRAIRAVQQLRGECATNQVEGARIAMCTAGGAGGFNTDLMLLSNERP
jgi:acetyl-CoA acetyltransferase